MSDPSPAFVRRGERLPGQLGRLLARRRRQRFRAMLAEVRTWEGMRVIDLGCGRDGRSTTDHAPASWTIVGVDVLPPGVIHHDDPGFRYVRTSACDLSAFDDGEFDLAVSVGLLEHIVEPEAFARAVTEIERVARQFALVVPCRYAWIEPHYLVPFFPVLPRSIQNWLVRGFDLHGHRAAVAADPEAVARRTTWRSNAEYRAAFPGAIVRRTATLETVLIAKGMPA